MDEKRDRNPALEIRHVETFDVTRRKITVHFAPNSRLYHADVMNHRHIPSVNRPINPLGLLALPRKIPIYKQLFCVRDTPTKNTVHQRTGQDSLYDYRITYGDERNSLFALDHMKMRRVVIAVVDRDFYLPLLAL